MLFWPCILLSPSMQTPIDLIFDELTLEGGVQPAAPPQKKHLFSCWVLNPPTPRSSSLYVGVGGGIILLLERFHWPKKLFSQKGVHPFLALSAVPAPWEDRTRSKSFHLPKTRPWGLQLVSLRWLFCSQGHVWGDCLPQTSCAFPFYPFTYPFSCMVRELSSLKEKYKHSQWNANKGGSAICTLWWRTVFPPVLILFLCAKMEK